MACNTTSKQKENYNGFGIFLKNFKKSTLPVTIRACKETGKNLLILPENTAYVNEPSLAYCIFKTNGDYVAAITLGSADCLVPILTTYNLDGEKIDEKKIMVGRCGSDCGYTCEEFMILKPDFSIYTSDTISSFACDSLGNAIPETTKRYVIYRKGKLLKTGKIALGKEIKETIISSGSSRQ